MKLSLACSALNLQKHHLDRFVSQRYSSIFIILLSSWKPPAPLLDATQFIKCSISHARSFSNSSTAKLPVHLHSSSNRWWASRSTSRPCSRFVQQVRRLVVRLSVSRSARVRDFFSSCSAFFQDRQMICLLFPLVVSVIFSVEYVTSIDHFTLDSF